MDRDLRLILRGGALQVERAGVVVQAVRTHAIREVHLYGDADMSAGARNLLLREGIDVVFLTADGRYRGRLCTAADRSSALRLAQYGLVSDPARRLALARAVVAGKVANQRALLGRRARRSEDPDLRSVLASLDELPAAVAAAPDLDTLRGHEGRAAALYFRGLARVIRNPDFTFPARTRRPPRDAMNACLSFGYTLLVIRAEHAVRTAGLDPGLGALHEANRGAPALALDLAEEARTVVDDLVLTLVNRRQLDLEDFRRPLEEEVGEGREGAVYLGKVGRTILIRAWERRLREGDAHPLSHETWRLLDLFQEQARQVARLARGEATAYIPLHWGVR